MNHTGIRFSLLRVVFLVGVIAAGAGLASLPAASAVDASRTGQAQIDPGWEIAFVSERDGNREIYVMSADGSAVRRLTDHPAADVYPAWSPDGARIAFVSGRDGNADIYVMNTDGTAPQRLTNSPAEEASPAWSPDRARIAFVSASEGNREIYVMNADGSNPQRLTTDPGDDVAPGWNPAGTAIVFAAERDGNAEIYLMDAGGASQRRLTTSFGMDAGHPAWSPNGERISFTAGQDGVGDLFVTDVAGNTLLQLNVEPDRLGRLDWSPDGAWIAFSSERDGNGELYAMAANGSSVVRLTDNPADDFDPHWRPTSVGPCQVRTDRWGTELRVGPGYNRGVFTDLPPNQLVTVIGQAQANDLSLWWELDKTQIPKHQNALSLWVAQDDVEEVGGCGVVPLVAAPPIVRPTPQAEPAPVQQPQPAPAAVQEPQPAPVTADQRPAGAGGWGACGSCNTCGMGADECVLSPDGACLWDPSTCRYVPEGTTDCKFVTVSGEPSGAGTVVIQTPPNCGKDGYMVGTSVSILATGRDPFWVNEFNGTCEGAAVDVHWMFSSINVIVNRDCSVTAYFRTY